MGEPGQDPAAVPPRLVGAGAAFGCGEGGHLHANMGTIKDRNGMDLAEAEDIKKR